MVAMMIHCGGVAKSLGQVEGIPVPEPTDSYVPIAHIDLVNTIHTVAGDMLPDHRLVDTQFATSKDGQRLFGLSTWRNGETTDDMGLAVGYRNSYDRSMTVGVAMGARVFVCDNLALSGEMASFKFKHTGDVMRKLNEAIITSLYSARHTFSNVKADAERLAQVEVSTDSGYRFLGSLYGQGVLSANQFSTAGRHWVEPAYEDFAPRNAWSLYNSANTGLKSTPIRDIMGKHLKLHEVAIAEFVEVSSVPSRFV